jgi:hypothetical protein
MSMRELQDALPTWVTMERPHGTAEVTHSQVGNIPVVEVMGFPETPEHVEHGMFSQTPPDVARANVHFVEIAPTMNFPDREELIFLVRSALGEGEWATMTAEDLSGGPSYIALGGWLGSQDLALMLIGAVELAGIAKAITPEVLGMEGEMAHTMAGNGFVMLGPSTDWADES